MKLKIYNTENSKGTNTGKPTVRINKKSGLFSLSKAASELIGIVAGDKIVFVQDEDSPADWFIQKTTDASGFSLRQKGTNDGGAFNCTKLAHAILGSKSTFNYVGYPVCAAQVIEGLNYHLIVTSKPLSAK